MTGAPALAARERPKSVLTRERVRNYSAIIVGSGALALLLAVVLGHYPLVAGGQPFLPDYLAHWTGGRLLITGHAADLYDPQAQTQLQHSTLPGYQALAWFVSPPFAAALYAPFALLPYGVSAALWLVVNLGLLAMAFVLVRPLLTGRLRNERGLFTVAFLATPAVFEVIGSGQDSVLVLVLWIAALRLLRTGRDLPAGALCGLLLIKPQLVVLVPLLFLVRRRWRAFAGFAATVAALAAVSVLLVGPEGSDRWLRTLGSPLYAAAVQHGQAWKMQSVAALMTALTGSELPGYLVLVVGAGVLVVVLVRTRPDVSADWAILALVTVACSPHVMLYDLVLLLPAAAWIFSRPQLSPIKWSSVLVVVLGWSTAARHALAGAIGPAGSLIDAPWSALPLAMLTYFVITERLGQRHTEPVPSVPPASSTTTGQYPTSPR